MPIDQDMANSWMSRESIPGVKFNLNDAVTVTAEDGVFRGAVISLLEVSPEVIYLVETTDGKDIHAKQSSLSRIAA